MFGKVYVIEFENGRVKIGRSKNAKQRIRILETQSCNSTIKVYTSEDCFNYKKIETELLRNFKHNRTMGEYVDARFEDVVSKLETLKLDVYSKEIYEKMKNDHDIVVADIIKTFSTDYSYKSKENKNVHCNFCLIPIEYFAENKILSCEEYSDLLDIQSLFDSEKEFYECQSNKLYKLEQINEFKKIQLDLGTWY